PGAPPVARAYGAAGAPARRDRQGGAVRRAGRAGDVRPDLRGGGRRATRVRRRDRVRVRVRAGGDVSDERPAFNQVNLVVRDIDASRAFYERLGVAVGDAPDWPPGSGARHANTE